MRTRTLEGRPVRWSLAAVLTMAGGVDLYLAASEGVVWPVPLAVLWLGFAAAVLLPVKGAAKAAARPERAPFIPAPRGEHRTIGAARV